MSQSNLSSVLTHLSAFLLGVEAGIIAIGLYAFGNIADCQEGLDCQEKECPTQPTLELTVPEIVDLNPPHLGVYQYLNTGMEYRLILYPTMFRLNPPSKFLMTKIQAQSQDEKVKLDTADHSVLPVSEKQKVNVPSAEPILTNMTEFQNDNSVNFVVDCSVDIQPNVIPTKQSSKTLTDDIQETPVQETPVQETPVQENTIVLLAQLKEEQS